MCQEGLNGHATISCLPESWYLGQLAGVAGMAHLELLRRQLKSCCGPCRGQVQQPFLPLSTDRIWQSVNFTSAVSYQVPTASREQGPCFRFLSLRYIVPQTWWLKTTENYSVGVLQARSLKSRWRIYISPGSSRGTFSFVSSVLCPCCWHSSTCGLTAASLPCLPLQSYYLLLFCLSNLPCVFPIEMCDIGFSRQYGYSRMISSSQDS